mmetsp:Transcript_9597/g.10613  ORF Transcript_9597/g.10613 Transcript_9597/m.10613 type:complete len:150 (-) Transcript_9597:1321-1770(-)
MLFLTKPWIFLAALSLIHVSVPFGFVSATLDDFLDTASFTSLPGVTATFDKPEITYGVLNNTTFYVYSVNTQRTINNVTQSGASIYIVKPQDLRVLNATYPPIFIPDAISAHVPQFTSDSEISVFYTKDNVLTVSYLAFTSNSSVTIPY